MMQDQYPDQDPSDVFWAGSVPESELDSDRQPLLLCFRCGAARWSDAGVCPRCGAVRQRPQNCTPWWQRRDWSDLYPSLDRNGRRRPRTAWTASAPAPAPATPYYSGAHPDTDTDTDTAQPQTETETETESLPPDYQVIDLEPEPVPRLREQRAVIRTASVSDLWGYLSAHRVGALSTMACIAAALILIVMTVRLAADAAVDEVPAALDDTEWRRVAGAGNTAQMHPEPCLEPCLEPWPGQLSLAAAPREHHTLRLTTSTGLTILADPVGAVVVHNNVDLLNGDGCAWGAEHNYPDLHVLPPDGAAGNAFESRFFIVGCRSGSVSLDFTMQTGDIHRHVFDVQQR